MNTTALITQWSMAGAGSDLEARFGSVEDLHALIRSDEQEREALRPGPVLFKRADEDDWQPLAQTA